MGEVATRFDMDTAYSGSAGAARNIGISIFSDRGYLRAELAEDATAAGLRIANEGPLARLLDPADVPALAELVLVDCPMVEGAELAALCRLDDEAVRRGSQVVVSTSMGSLDAVFGCLDRSDAQILVTPSRGDRVIALGRMLARAGNRVRELSQEDRLALLRLTEQVGQIASRLDALAGSSAPADDGPVFSFAEASAPAAFPASGEVAEDVGDRLVRAARPPLPDPRLVRKIIRQRQLRARFFEGDLFADPAWDMLLDLTAAQVEHVRVSVTSLCIASGVPPTTALRWIGQMTDAGLLQRVDDQSDRRRAFITLTDKAAESMARYFAEVGALAGTTI